MREDFLINTDELDAVIAHLEATERELDSIDADLGRQMVALRSAWEGLAAQGQQEAYDHWRHGMSGMRAALREMREAARSAHGSYTEAAATNMRMWAQIS